jgi:hypothetical protein
MRRRTSLQFAGAAAAASPDLFSCTGFPNRAVSLVVPIRRAGPTDTLTRIMAEAMQRPLGQSVLVENVTRRERRDRRHQGGARQSRRLHAVDRPRQLAHHHLGGAAGPGFELLRDMTPVLLWAVNPSFLSARRGLEPTTLRS